MCIHLPVVQSLFGGLNPFFLPGHMRGLLEPPALNWSGGFAGGDAEPPVYDGVALEMTCNYLQNLPWQLVLAYQGGFLGTWQPKVTITARWTAEGYWNHLDNFSRRAYCVQAERIAMWSTCCLDELAGPSCMDHWHLLRNTNITAAVLYLGCPRSI